MKHSILITSGMVAGLLFASAGATAAPHDSQHIAPQKHITKKVANKKHSTKIRGVNIAQFERMIRNGTKSGRLTNGERRTAKAGLNSLKATIKAVEKDRRVSNWEQKRVKTKSVQLKRNINRLINNRTVAKRGKNSRHMAQR